MEGIALNSKTPQPSELVVRLENEIAEAVQDKSMVEYCEWALDSLRKAVSFDRALWVLGTSEGDFEVVASQGVDARKVEEGYAGLNRIDPVFEHFKNSPDTVLCIDITQLGDDRRSLRDWVEEMSLPIVMSLGTLQPESGVIQGINVYRSLDCPRFSAGEAERYKPLALALLDGLRKVRTERIRKELFENWAQQNHLATVTDAGAIFDIEDGFLQGLRLNFPNWSGPLVPEQIQRYLKAPSTSWSFRQKSVRISSRPAKGLSLLVMTDLGPLGQLTDKQYQVASMYARGDATKVIARKLCNEASTIENHRKSIYARLDISSNNELTRLFTMLDGFA